jgi:hypothetical protein
MAKRGTATGCFCRGQLPAGGTEPASAGKHGYDIPVSEAKARAAAEEEWAPALTTPVDYTNAVEDFHRDGTRGS